MNGLDIVLINVISYLGGILSGIYINHKMNKNKKENQDNLKKEKDSDDGEKYNSPILAAAYPPPTAPPMNPNFSQNTLQKRFTITAE